MYFLLKMVIFQPAMRSFTRPGRLFLAQNLKSFGRRKNWLRLAPEVGAEMDWPGSLLSGHDRCIVISAYRVPHRIPRFLQELADLIKGL